MRCLSLRSGVHSLLSLAAMAVALPACDDDDVLRRDAGADGAVVADGSRPDTPADVPLGDGAEDRPDTSGVDGQMGNDAPLGADVPMTTDGAPQFDGATVLDTGAGLDTVGTGDGRPTAVDGSASEAGGVAVHRPELRPATAERISQLRVPSGFRLRVFARDLTNPRMLAVGPDGSVYVTSPMTSQVIRLVDRDGDGTATGTAERSTVVTGDEAADLQGVHGITISNGRLYLASIKAVYAADLSNGSLTGLTRLVGDLPDGGQHANRTLAVGPDGKLYVTIGSTCNACNESNSEHAAMLRLELDGGAAANPENPAHPMIARNPLTTVSRRVFASGLRNTLGFDWHPVTGELVGADHGSDGLGNDVPPDELNVIVGGKSYGWPYCWGNRAADPTVDDPSRALSKEAYCATTEPVRIALPAHSAPIGFLFYRGGQFPSQYVNDAFVTFRGSWNRDVPTGYKVVRVRFPAGTVEDFLTGFLIESGAAQFGRVAGLAVDNEGALLVAEDSNGVIYRVTYEPTPMDGGTLDASGGGS